MAKAKMKTKKCAPKKGAKKTATKSKPGKFVYFFGGGTADGNAAMKELLGGKGANLAEMAKLGVPVPPGFTLTTEVCTYYYQHKKTYPNGLKEEVAKAMAKIEKIMGKKFGDPKDPLLVSVRSGARSSMPGMMETVLNIGLTSKTIPGIIARSGNERFVYDAYRRLIMMYSDVVMEKAAGIEPKEDEGIRRQLEKIMDQVKKSRGYALDTDLSAEDLKSLCEQFKQKVKEVLGKNFPDDPQAQLWGGIHAVFSSWNGKRAVSYRRIEGIPDEWGTAVNVQTMVFGNLAMIVPPALPFQETPATAKTNSMANTWSMPRARTSWRASVRRPRSMPILSLNTTKTCLLSKKACPRFISSWSALKIALKNTTGTCRTSSLPSNAIGCLCSSAA